MKTMTMLMFVFLGIVIVLRTVIEFPVIFIRNKFALQIFSISYKNDGLSFLKNIFLNRYELMKFDQLKMKEKNMNMKVRYNIDNEISKHKKLAICYELVCIISFCAFIVMMFFSVQFGYAFLALWVYSVISKENCLDMYDHLIRCKERKYK